MRSNLPVTGREHEMADGTTLMSATDTESRLVYANDAFVQTSGFDPRELIGEPHNVVRHPDMPPAAFADLWETLRAGRSWSALARRHASASPERPRGASRAAHLPAPPARSRTGIAREREAWASAWPQELGRRPKPRFSSGRSPQDGTRASAMTGIVSESCLPLRGFRIARPGNGYVLSLKTVNYHNGIVWKASK